MKRTLPVFFMLILSFLSTLSAHAQTQKPLEISRITPTGNDVAATRQIVIEFTVPLSQLAGWNERMRRWE